MEPLREREESSSSEKHVGRVMNIPLNPTLYSKTGVCRGIPFFLFLLQNIDYGYSLEPPRRSSKRQKKTKKDKEKKKENLLKNEDFIPESMQRCLTSGFLDSIMSLSK